MNYALARAHVPSISRFLRARVLLAFDFDGTLAPIVADRAAARMRRQTVRLLERVSKTYPCAVISGRSPEDVATRLEGLPVRFVVGHHGLDPAHASSTIADRVAAAREHLAAALAASAGVEIEDKRLSLAIHYRAAAAPATARAAITRVLRELSGSFRVLPGKRVYDVLPAGAPHKGDALERLRRVAAADAAIYIGDDVTDEDVFRQAHPDRLLAIRVGRSRRSAAPYYLRDQRDLDAFLRHVALTCA
ncbi:MAG TPA: trehalose-phosphatase [Polyangia bacterium]|nr:trehalose-phosphatase [Polyangia bacterium]